MMRLQDRDIVGRWASRMMLCAFRESVVGVGRNMVAYRFVHTADVRLDSPLRSLAMRDPDLAELIRNATRHAFEKVVRLCIGEEVDALLIAGDLYDGSQTSMCESAPKSDPRLWCLQTIDTSWKMPAAAWSRSASIGTPTKGRIWYLSQVLMMLLYRVRLRL